MGLTGHRVHTAEARNQPFPNAVFELETERLSTQLEGKVQEAKPSREKTAKKVKKAVAEAAADGDNGVDTHPA